MPANATERRAQEEQLDWLHEMHEELSAQTDLMERQTEALERSARYLSVVYAAAILWLIGVVIAPFVLILLNR